MQKSSHVTGAADSKSQVPAVIGLNEEVHCTFCDFFCGGFDQQKGWIKQQKMCFNKQKMCFNKQKNVLINKKMF